MIQNSDGVATVRARLPWVDDGDDWHKAEVADLYVRAARMVARGEQVSINAWEWRAATNDGEDGHGGEAPAGDAA